MAKKTPMKKETAPTTSTSSLSAVMAAMPQQSAHTPTQADVAQRAYELYLERGGEHGHDMEDWLRAEDELRHRPYARA